MPSKKFYVEIEIELETEISTAEGDEGEYISDQGWQDHARLDGLYDVMGDIVKHVGMPHRNSRRKLTGIN
jgi:hypothetical protein